MHSTLRSYRLASRLLALVFCLMEPMRAAASPAALQITLYWEGRELLDPNLEALEKLRLAYPAVPFLHLINPSYFLDSSATQGQLKQMLRVLHAEDEVGLYLSSINGLTQAAEVPMHFQPSFWGDADDQKFCEDDCGIDVPLNGRSREELLRIMATAQFTLQQAGFRQMRSYAVRGWADVALLRPLAALFGYRHDLTQIDPDLIPRQYRHYPFSVWIRDQWQQRLSAGVARDSEPRVEEQPNRGASIEWSEPSAILKRFDSWLETKPTEDASFQLVFSQETAYYAAARLGKLLRALEDKAQQQDFKLSYSTPSDLHNALPLVDAARLSAQDAVFKKQKRPL